MDIKTDPIKCLGCVEEKSEANPRWQCMGCNRVMVGASQDRYMTAAEIEAITKERLTLRTQLTVNVAELNGERTIEFRDLSGKLVWEIRT